MRGYTPNGDPIWTPEEDNILRNNYYREGGYRAIATLFAHRSLGGVRHRMAKLGLRMPHKRKNHRWSYEEGLLLKRSWKAGVVARTLIDLFPFATVYSIRSKARQLGLKRGRAPFLIVGQPLYDELRRRVRKTGMSLADIDFYLGREKYFAGRGGMKPLFRVRQAVRAIGGKIINNEKVIWPD